MSVLARTKLSTRMQLLVGLTLVGLLVLCVTALFQLKETMLDDRKEKVHNIVEVGLGIIAHHHKLAADGKLSEAEAKQAARDALRGLRFASSDYYFGIDTSGVYYLHGGNPAFEGQLKIDLKDTNGKFIIKELIAAAQAGGGYVDYWFPRAGQQVSEPKLSYAALFAPWNWVIGTGIYIDDIEREYRSVAMLLGGLHQLLQIQARGVRRHNLQFGGIAQPMVDLVMEDQGQAGQCQHQHRQRMGRGPLAAATDRAGQPAGVRWPADHPPPRTTDLASRAPARPARPVRR